jgi:PAS domain S-box-containing protein
LFSRLNITTKGLILVLVPVVLEVIFISKLTSMISETYVSLARMERSIGALSELTSKRSQLLEALCTAVDPDEKNISKRLMAIARAQAIALPDPNFVREYPEMAEYRQSLDDFNTHLNIIVGKFKQQVPFNSASGRWGSGIPPADLIPLLIEARSINDNGMRIEKELGSLQPNELARFRSEFGSWLIIGLLSSYLICAWISRAFYQDTVSRLQNISQNARLISYGQPLQPVQGGTDEIAQLDALLVNAGNELKEARRREFAILDNATDVLCSVDRNLKIKDIGKAATRNWGYQLDELEGRSILSILSGDSVDSTVRAFDEIAEESKEGQIENSVICKDGAARRFQWTLNWQPDDRLFYCVGHDVSQIRAMEKLKQDFLAMVSHDLRTPLNSVSIGLGMLVDERLGALPEAAKVQLGRSRSSMERLSHLLNDLLEIEKFGSGKIVLNKELSSTFEICEFAIEQLETLAVKSKVTLVAPKSDQAIFVDPKRITQVLVNLLSNAIKYSPSGSSVVFDVRNVEGHVEIGISDSGPGIAPEQRDWIFDRFRQAGAAEKAVMKSTGLGLSIAQMIVKEHGGSIGVESKVGKGSRFWIRLPSEEDGEDDLL